MTHNADMLTRDQLAKALQDVNVEDLAEVAKVSAKTIYRLRHKRHAPTLDTVARLLDGIKRLKATRPSKAA